jgi:hypothetical protein
LLGVGSGAGSLAGNTTTLGRIGTGFMYADDYNENGSTGVTLAAVADGANVRVSYTASNTGSSGTINYSIANLG